MKQSNWDYGIIYEGTVEECLAAGLVTPDQVPDGVRCSSMTWAQGRRVGAGPWKCVDATYLKVCYYRGSLRIFRGSDEGQAKLLADRAEQRAHNARWAAAYALLPDDLPEHWFFLRPLAHDLIRRGGTPFAAFVLKSIGFAREPFMLPDSPRRPDACA